MSYQVSKLQYTTVEERLRNHTVITHIRALTPHPVLRAARDFLRRVAELNPGLALVLVNKDGGGEGLGGVGGLTGMRGKMPQAERYS